MWAVLTNIHRQFKIFRVMAQPAYERMVLADPRIPFKHLSRNYLARNLTVAERAACLMHHYSYLHERLPSKLLHQALQRDVTMFEVREGGSLYRVAMGLSRTQVREGEFFLNLEVDGMQVYILQFTIVPGWVVKSGAPDVLLVTRLQGMKGCYSQIYQATKVLKEVAPPALLMTALQGVAKACGIYEFAGVCARSQFSHSEYSSSTFNEAYDQFFTQLGMCHSSANYYSCPLPIPEKPVDNVKNGHRSRTRKKRAYKLEIADRVCQLISESR